MAKDTSRTGTHNKPGLLTLTIKDKSALYMAYMPFVRNGGLFIPTNSGYRLVYQPGNETGLLLQRIVGKKVTQLGAYNDPIELEDGKVHQLIWSRDANGKMRVYVDGQQMIIATDTQITGNLDGWLNVNQGGTYWIREIKVEGI